MKKIRKIKIYADGLSSLVSPFNKEIISDELNNYILHSCQGFSVKGELTLNIIGSFNNQEQEQLIQALKNYYSFNIKHYKNIDKYDDWIRLFLLILGFLLIFASTKFDYVINEFLSIIGWLVIWETGYDIFFNSRRRQSMRYKQIYSSKIIFSQV